jgi:hypothetical protein
MAQIFHPFTNSWSKVSLICLVAFLAVIGAVGYRLSRSSYVTQVGVARPQPVPFSHEHHVKRLGIDCRYCHTSVETSAFAGMPPTKTCMNCHSHVWADSPMLEPVRESFRTGKPLEWTRVHDLPDFVYFHHGIHVQKGIACASCHGEVEAMPLLWKEASLQMEWCLECHRRPDRHVRPRDKVFESDWTPPAAPEERRALVQALMKQHNVESPTSCSVCHR